MIAIKTLIIVEGPNDEAFLRLLLKHNGLSAIQVNAIETIGIESLHHVDGTALRGKSALDEKIERLKGELRFSRYSEVSHVSIILDADFPPDGGVQKSMEWVNEAIGSKLGMYPNFSKEGEHKSITANCSGEQIPITFSCFFIQHEKGVGHLDLLLKEIATKGQEVPYCLCLEEQLLPCLADKGAEVKDFEKQWINHYLRHFATKQQLKQAEQRLSEVIVNKGEDIFDLNHPFLEKLNHYLSGI
jgi:hypothetical protein